MRVKKFGKSENEVHTIRKLYVRAVVHLKHVITMSSNIPPN